MTLGMAVLLLVAQPPMPNGRNIVPLPVVTEVGLEPRTDSGVERVPVTPALALADLELIDLDAQTAFPASEPTFPADSLVVGRMARGRAWLADIARSTETRGDPVLRGELQASAGDDSGAVRTFDGALVGAPPSRASYVHARAIATFLDEERDDTAFARRLRVAERYLARLIALPAAGYPRRYDSLVVLRRTYESALAVLVASCHVGDARQVAAHANDVLTVLRRFGQGAGGTLFKYEFPVEGVATALLGEPLGEVHWRELQTRIVAAVGATDAVRRRLAQADIIGGAMPPIVGHAWLNTRDSLYEPVPRSHQLDDGVVRVVFFVSDSWTESPPVFPVLSRVHASIQPWGQVIAVMQTEGHAVNDLVEPAEEVAWIEVLNRDEVHLTAVIGLWAGNLEATENGDRQPASSPNHVLSRDALRFTPAAVVDGSGVVRGLFRLGTHRDELELRKVLDYLHAEATGTATLASRPARITVRGAGRS